MDLDKLRELIRIFEDSDLSEIEVEEEGHRVHLRKPRPQRYHAQPIAITAQHTEGSADLAVRANDAEPAQEQAAAEPEPAELTVDSPMVGVFYAAPAPGEPPFVRPGDTVRENQTVCIVEAMKLMNEVTAKFPGVIERVLVENGEPVEFGQPLFAVRPLE